MLAPRTSRSDGGALPSQDSLTPSNAAVHVHTQGTPNLATPIRAAMQTPRGTTSHRDAGGRGGADDMITHKRLSHRRLAVYDRVYGQILFPPVLRLFIDSPEVQRLRDLKQLGNGHYVFPSATHTRFEHSLGVAHLAMTFLKQILTNHAEEPELGEPLRPMLASHDEPGAADMQKEIWCVGIAGLCHDLGHGPLSHMFERYVNRVRVTEGKGKWSHEQASISMLRAIWERKRTELEVFGLSEKDRLFVELLINGLKPHEPWPEESVGRGEDLRFMTDIIANKRSGLDVDKVDYLQRDSLSCFGSSALVSLDRLFQGACVMRDDFNESQICYQEKLKGTVEEVFEARTRLHKIVYQHRVTCVMDMMTTDAFLLADKHFKISYNGKQYRLSECVDVPGAYIQTGDWVLNAILRSHDPALRPAQQILDRMQNRRIYTTIGTSVGQSDTIGFSEKGFLRHVEDPDLRARLTQWRDSHPGWPVLEQIQTKITKAAGDMERRLDPMDRICLFNPRHGAEARPFVRGSVPSRNSRATSYAIPADPDQTFIVICRMPLTVSDLNELSNTFNSVAADNGAADFVDRSVSPGRRRTSQHSSAVPSQNASGRGQYASPLPRMRSQGEPRPQPHSQLEEFAPLFEHDRALTYKRERTEAGGDSKDDTRSSTPEGHAHRGPRTGTDTAPPLVPPMKSWQPEDTVEQQGEQQHMRGGSMDADLMIPPPPKIHLQATSSHKGSTSPLLKESACAPAPQRRRRATPPRAGSSAPPEDSLSDVHLSMEPLSQLDNSRSNADEPEIRVEFSNLAPPTSADTQEEGSRMGPPVSQGSAAGKQRKYVTIDEATEKSQAK